MPQPNLLIDPSLQAQAAQQARMGQALMDSSMTPLQEVNTGQFYVAPSPWQALAKVVQAYAGKKLMSTSIANEQKAWQNQVGMLAGNMFGGSGANPGGSTPPSMNPPAAGTVPAPLPSTDSTQPAPTAEGNPAGNIPGDLASSLSNHLSQTAGGPVQPTTPQAQAVANAQPTGIPPDLAGAFPGQSQSQILVRALSDSAAFNKTRDAYNLQRAALTNEQKNANDIGGTYQQAPNGLAPEQLRTLMLGGNNLRPITVGADQFPYSPVSGVPQNFQTLPKAPEGASAGFQNGQPFITQVPGGMPAVYGSSLAENNGKIPADMVGKYVQGAMRPQQIVDPTTGNVTTNLVGSMFPPPPIVAQGLQRGGFNISSGQPGAAQAGTPGGQPGTAPNQPQTSGAPTQPPGVLSALGPATSAFLGQQGKAAGDMVTQYQHDANTAQIGAFNAQRVLDALQKDPTLTGPNQPFYSYLTGKLSDIPGIGDSVLRAAQGYTADRQYVTKALAQSAGARLNALGGTGSEAHLELAQEGSASPAMFGQTVGRLMQQELAINQATQAKNTWMSSNLANSPNPTAMHQQLQSSWNQNFNLQAYEYLNNPAMAEKEIPLMSATQKANIHRAATWMQQNGIDAIRGAQ